MFPLTKVLGPFSLSVADQGGGVFRASVALSATLGGGQASGVATFGGSIYADLSAEEVVALGFEELNKVLPAAVLPLAEAGEAAAEAQVEKL
ncbi:unnamed protein product [Sphagnum balticum]